MPLDSFFKVSPFRKPASQAAPVRVAVIGAGRMGQFHLKHLGRLPGAALAAVVDRDLPRAQAAARTHNLLIVSQLDDLRGRVDAAVVATPTSTHQAIGCRLLEAGISCLIEKPIAATIEEAERLIAAADKSDAVLQVGHIERFNPAVIEAARHIRAPRFIEVSRLGPYDPRTAGIGVVLDLMIHDLDIVLFLVGETVSRVEAFGAKVLSDHEDIAKVRLHFANGCIADLSASRVSLEKYRRIRIFQKDSYLSLDYAAPRLRVYRKRAATVRSLKDIEVLKPRLERRDPLALELAHFLQCVRDRETPLVSGRHGLSALELAQRVLRHLRVDV